VTDVRLHLLRHAHAGDPTKWHRPDAERPLSSRGVEQAEALGRQLRAADFRTDALVSSPKVRSEQTARLVGEALDVPVRVDDRLASGFAREELAALLRDLGDPSSPLLVGHDPDFSELLSELVGVPLELRKGSIARVDIAAPFEPGDGILRWLVPPEVLRAKA
jgi:phosphohistidine phosphatase